MASQRPPTPMTEQDKQDKILKYRSAVISCNMAMAILARHDLDEILRDIERAETLGPIVDPTLWTEKYRQLKEDKALIQAALPLYRHFRVVAESLPDGTREWWVNGKRV